MSVGNSTAVGIYRRVSSAQRYLASVHIADIKYSDL